MRILKYQTDEIDAAFEVLLGRLRAMQTTEGFWTGRLSNSALSTATAISALAVSFREQPPKPALSQSAHQSEYEKPERWNALIERGVEYLCRSQNDDGGFGDTNRSHSNIATTLLVIAAWRLAGKQSVLSDRIREAEAYVEREGKWEGLRRRYGKDKTFVVPILSNCALAGMVPWADVSPLPFEVAALPQSWYRFAQMPVVSYAIPALVAIGQARFVHAPPRNPMMRWLRWSALHRTRRVLRQMQPDSGGFLEATPLTSFVLMNLASIGLSNSDVAVACRKFIIDSIQADGSWPIDTNLATWVTSLAIHGLLHRATSGDSFEGTAASAVGSREEGVLSMSDGMTCSLIQTKTIDWLLSCQHQIRHPFTGAEPGGWGWTDLSGAVPDADDTPAALLALHAWQSIQARRVVAPKIAAAVGLGVHWLLKLQNRDGGWPTFCRGWGKLPFDRSGADLTAHALRALSKWSDGKLVSNLPADNGRTIQSKAIRGSMQRGLRYLSKQQQPDGSWLPLWFGNQDRPDEENPIYGTGRVLLALGDLYSDASEAMVLRNGDIGSARRAIGFLLALQNNDGGWGGGTSVRYGGDLALKALTNSLKPEPMSISSTIEETSVAIEGLAACTRLVAKYANDPIESGRVSTEELDSAIRRGVEWLTARIQDGGCEMSQPIGFYFAKLWYHEQLYPFVFAAAALNRVRCLAFAYASGSDGDSRL